MTYQIQACLPFVELAQEAAITLGPVLFWPSSKSDQWITNEDRPQFDAYLRSISQIKAQGKKELVDTVTLHPEGTTCLSLSEKVPEEQKESLLLDALYLLYFTCNFRNLYYGNEVLPFEPFRKMVPAAPSFFNHKENWKGVHIAETKREETVCINLFDQEIYQGLGAALSSIYEPDFCNDQKTQENYRRLIRSVRYLVDRFFPKFMNLLNQGLDFSQQQAEPEDILFLSSCFESLFNLDEKDPPADFKHKLRSILHLKYSRPVEIFWKWVDDFYALKRKIVHSGETPDANFISNPNFKINHVVLGIKLYIYAFYHTLFQYKLIAPIHFDEYTPPDFRWIHPEEILLFFWTESHLLRKLNVFIKRAQGGAGEEGLYAEISLLSDLYLTIYERYFLTPHAHQATFIPTPLNEIESYGKEIIEMIDFEQANHPKSTLLYSIPMDLREAIANRIAV